MKKPLVFLLGLACLCFYVPRPSHLYDPTHDTDGQLYFGCAVTGTGGDPYLNTLKNRTKPYHDSIVGNVTDIIHHLPQNISAKHGGERDQFFSLADWTAASQFESKGAMIEGYLVEKASEGKESCNCKDKKHHDYHLWIVPTATDTSLSKAMVVELTPRVWEQHPQWPKKLSFLISNKIPVRIHGWLTYDHEHPEQLPGPAVQANRVRRATLWEVHPVMYFEAQNEHGHWVPLEQIH